MTTMILDGNNIAHRARHAYNLSFKGKDTSVTFGFIKMMMSLCKTHDPSAILIAWDYGRPKFRNELCPTYKSNRHRDEDPTFPIFLAQVEELISILPHFGVVNVRRKGIEADDFMYHASRTIKGKCVIVSNDDDMLQAVTDRTYVDNGTIVTDMNYEEVTGYRTSQEFLCAKTLVGDGSDNLHGVDGIGKKTAHRLLAWPDGTRAASKYVCWDDAVMYMPEHDPYDGSAVCRKMLEYMASGEYENVYKTICLFYDRVGARHYMYHNIRWVPYNYNIVMRWCMKNGFASILESGSLGACFANLQKPELKGYIGHAPRIWDYERYERYEAS